MMKNIFHICLFLKMLLLVVSCKSPSAVTKAGESKQKLQLIETAKRQWKADSLQAAYYTSAELLQIDPTNAEAYFIQGEVHYEQKEWQKALEKYNEARLKGFSSAVLYHHLGYVFFEQQQPQIALKYYDSSISLNSNYAQVYYDKGNIHFDENKFEEAANAYMASLKNAYKPAEMYGKLGFSLSRIGKNREAIVYLTEAIKNYPDEIENYSHRGFAFIEVNYHEAAEKDLVFYLDKNPGDVIAMYNLARAQFGQNKLQEAINTWQKVLQIEPNYLDTHFKIGYTYAKMNDFKSALEAFDKAISANPNEGFLYYNRGIAKGRLNMTYCDDFKKAMDLGYTEAKKMYDAYCKQ